MDVGVVMHDGVADEAIAGEALSSVQVDLASEELAELALQSDELREADPGSGGELDQDVDVALRAEVLTEDRAEEGEATDAAALAEGRQQTGRP